MSGTRMFPGGIHPKEIGNGKGATQNIPIRRAKPPVRVVIPLQQHIGAPCTSTVEAGDIVHMGQVIGVSESFISAPIHASVSGKVVKLDRCVLPNGLNVPAVVIDNDFEDRRWPGAHEKGSQPKELTVEAMVKIVRDCGIVGLGGAAFPTSVKLVPPKDSPVDTVLLNAAECEPYLTCDDRLMQEEPEAILDGLSIVKTILGAGQAIVGIESNKPAAYAAMKAKATADVRLVELPVQYPQGGEKQLIYALTKRTVPLGKLPASVGVVVINVATAWAIHRAVREGLPLIERVVTVTGRVGQPANLLVRVGTTVADLIDECGGLTDGVEEVVLGGPMMGAALSRLDVPVSKATSGILALGKEAVPPPELACMHCGRCNRVCPMCLMPNVIDAAARKSQWDVAEDYNALACLECGACTFTCPSKRQLTQSCRTAKAGVQAKRARAQQAKGV